jgi:hypothetical protein
MGIIGQHTGAFVELLEDRRLLAVPSIAVQMMHHAGATSVHAAPSVSTTHVAITATAGQPFSGLIGTVKKLAGIAADFSNLQGAITWGDGSSSAASFARNPNGSIAISGDHTWQNAGVFRVSVTLSRTPINTTGGPNIFAPIRVATIRTTAKVAPANVPTSGGVTFTAVAGQSFTQNLGGFHFFNVDLLLTPHISWGDGTASVGDLGGGLLAGGDYTVTGTHTYAHAGQYKIHVVVNSSLFGQPPTAVLTGYVAQFDSIANVMGSA